MRNTLLIRNVRNSSGTDVIETASARHHTLSKWMYVWIPVVLIFGVGDILTTQFALSLGAAERNTIVKYLIEGPGGVWAFGAVKAAILVPLVLFSASLEGILRWLLPCFFLCTGICLLAVNLAVIGGLI